MAEEAPTTPTSSTLAALIGVVGDGENLDDDIFAKISAILSAEDDLFVVANDGGIVSVLELLDKESDKLQKLALDALTTLTCEESFSRAIVDNESVPKIASLIMASNEDIANAAATAMSNICMAGTLQARVGEKPIVETLVRGLESVVPSVREASARSLSCLAWHHGVRELIVDIGSIPKLVKMLEDPQGSVRGEAGRTLANLSCTDKIELMIAEANSIPILLKNLDDDDDAARAGAACAIANLTSHVDNTQRVVSAGAVPILLKHLSEDSNLEVKRQVASTLANLAVGGGEPAKKLADSAVDVLVGTAMADDADLQGEVMRTVAAISEDEAVHSRLIALGLPKLVSSLLDAEAWGVKQQATIIIANLSRSVSCLGSLMEHGIIPGVIRNLEDADEETRMEAVKAVCNLARHNKHTILVSSGVVRPLVNLLAEENDTSRQYAICAIASLACSDDAKPILLNASIIDAVLPLFDDHVKDVRMYTMCTLGNFTSNATEATPLFNADYVERIVGLFGDRSGDCRREAARVLSNLLTLAVEQDSAENVAIVAGPLTDEHGIPLLVRALSDKNTDARTQAASMVALLSCQPSAKAPLLAAGVHKEIMSLLLKGKDEDVPDAILNASLIALANLVPGNKDIKPLDFVPLLPLLVKVEDAMAQLASLMLLAEVACAGSDGAAAVVAANGVPIFAVFLKSGVKDAEISAAKGLAALSSHPEHRRLVAQGARKQLEWASHEAQDEKARNLAEAALDPLEKTAKCSIFGSLCGKKKSRPSS